MTVASAPMASMGVLRDLGLVALLWLVMIVVIDPTGNFPLNDDWVYARSVKTLVDSGRFEVLAFSNASVGPQVLWGALASIPFGFSFDALRASTLVLALLGLWAVYGLFLETWKSRSIALIGAFTLAVNPLWFALANSFMTDVPFTALLAIGMYLAVRGLATGHRGLLLASVACGLALTLQRQFGLVFFVGFALAFIARNGWRQRTIAIAIAPLVLALMLNFGFSHWLIVSGRKIGQQGSEGHELLPIWWIVHSLPRALWNVMHYLGLFTLPLGIACMCRERGRRGWLSLASVVALTIVLVVDLTRRGRAMPLLENILTIDGIGPITLYDVLLSPLDAPAPDERTVIFWTIVTILSAIGTAILLIALAVGAFNLARSIRAASFTLQDHWKLVFIVGVTTAYIASLVGVVMFAFVLFDRYLLPLALLASLALPVLGRQRIAPGRRPSHLFLTTGAVTAFAIATTLLVRDYLAWNRMRWDVLTRLTNELGIAPNAIDGGYEFNGWELYDAQSRHPTGKQAWWVIDDAYLLALSPRKGYDVIERHRSVAWLRSQPRELLVLHRR